MTVAGSEIEGPVRCCFSINAVVLLERRLLSRLSGSSRVATPGETTAPSRMEQSVNVGGALLPLVRSGNRGADARFVAAEENSLAEAR